MDVRYSKLIDRWSNGWMDGCMDVNRWMAGWMFDVVNRWMDGW